MTTNGTLAELRRGWPVLATATFGVSVGLSLLVYGFSAFIRPLETSFGWSRTAIALAPAFVSLTLLLSAALAGRLCDRIGARAVILRSIPLFAIALAGLSLVGQSVAWLYLGFAIAAAAGVGTSTIAYTRIVSRWFMHARGLALGIATTGSGISALVLPVLLTHVIEMWGWRTGWLAAGAIAALALPPAWAFLHDRPASDHATIAVAVPGATMREVVRGTRFWSLAVAAMLVSTTAGGTVVHLIAMLGELGIAPASAAWQAAMLGLGIIVGRLLAGYLLDHVPGPPLAMLLFLTSASGFLILFAGATALIPLAIFMVGLTVGSEGDLLAFFTGRYFGLKSYAEIYGWLFVCFSCGTATGPALVGLLYTTEGGYGPVYLAFAGLCIAAAGLMTTLGRYPEVGAEMPVTR